ncbi:MAG: outer membrane beta-barrel protein [Pseudomonadota bacterium]
MRRLVIAALSAATFVSTPALARDGSMYIGLEAGAMKPATTKLDYRTSAVSAGDALRIKHKWGWDADLVTGYDFGMFRLEGEVGYKSASTRQVDVSTAAAADTGTVAGVYDADGKVRVASLMANALFDFDTGSAVGGSVGVGVGTANVRYRAGMTPGGPLNFSGRDNALAWQAIAELRTAVSATVDVGLKYRYFRTGKLNFGDFCETTCGGLDPYRLRGHFSSNSLLASLIVNLASRVAVAPPPPVMAPPPPPPAPATQTCPDGSVILATSVCPVPPPPPPPPPPVERGERGQ